MMSDLAERKLIDTSLRYIDDLGLMLPPPAPRMATLLAPAIQSTLGSLPSAQNQDAGAVLDDSLLAFTGGLSDQNRDDVMDSLLLMQLAASKKYNKEKEANQWYSFYHDGLSRLGWLTTARTFQDYSPHQSSFTMDEIALEIIAQVGGPNFAHVARKAATALANNEKALRVFEKSGSSEQVASFKMLPCVQTAQGDVVMMLNFMNFVKTARTKKVLFFTFNRDQVRITRSADRVQLNARQYANLRQSVSQKLGRIGEAFIEGLEI